jgi:excinuclease ABC subunit A
VIVVEHDEDTMRRADRIYDLGPGAGMFGGELVAQGTLAEVCAHPGSPTGQALKEPMPHPLRGARRSVLPAAPAFGRARASKAAKKSAKTAGGRPVSSADVPTPGSDVPGTSWLTLTGCHANNLRDLTIGIPLQRLTVITGVSGSGKSSFMRGVLQPAVSAALAGKKPKIRPTWEALTGADRLDAVYEVDQSPIGKTSRSTPATYIGIFDDIRKLFASLPESRMRGFTASRFSFNTEGGRCEACKGNGQQKLEMAFLPTSWLPCDECHGLRYNAATLEVEYNGKNIGQVMRLTIDEAAGFFAAVPSIARTLRLLVETGVGYLQLGQPSPTLSGGEAQRIKLVTELTKGLGRSERARLRQNQVPHGSLYLIEEPTIGLHPQDVRRLIHVLHGLVDDGHTVVVIEHNLDVAAEADWVLDIGPEAGDAGGALVAEGTPEAVATARGSRTAPFLSAVLAAGGGA